MVIATYISHDYLTIIAIATDTLILIYQSMLIDKIFL